MYDIYLYLIYIYIYIYNIYIYIINIDINIWIVHRIWGWELGKSLFSELVLAVAVSKTIYSHLNNISSYRRKILFQVICFYIRHNGVAFFLTSPSGASVSSLMTQKFSHRFSRSLKPSLLTFNISVNFSTRVNFGCFMKLWRCILKWLHAGITFGLLTSLLWLISLKWNAFLDFPTYWILNNMHSIK